MPDETAFNRKSERNSRSLTGLLETTSESMRIYSGVVRIKYISHCSILDDLA
jgi:hypothetical protein